MRRFMFAAAIFAAMVLLVFHDTLFRSDLVVASAHSAIWSQFYPWRQFGFGELRRGHLALWDPWLFSGAPFLGAFQSALLYPPNWLFMPLRTALAMNLGIALHVFLAGVFMYCWSAYRRLRWPACVAAGLVFMFGGQEFGRVIGTNLSNLDTLVWAPLIFLAIDDLTTTRSLRGALVGSAAFAMQIFAGHAQYAFYTAVVATIYFALNLRAAPRRWRAAAGYALCFAGGGLIAAAQLFTGLGATAEAMRSHTDAIFAGSFSFPPENLITMILPAFFGDNVTSPYWGRWFWVEANIYVGVVGFALACFALGKPGRQRRFAFTTLIVILVMGMGSYTPAFWVIYRLPLFSSFRGLSKMMFLFVMFVALLSGIGLDRLLRGEVKRIWPTIAVAAGALASLAMAAVINASALSDFSSPWGRLLGWINWSDERALTRRIDLDFLYHSARAAAGDACWAGIIGLLLAGLIFAGRKYRRALWGIPVLMAVELAAFALPRLPEYSVADYRAHITTVGRYLAPLPADARVWAFDQGELFLAGRLNSWGDDPMMLRRYIDFVGDALGVSPDSLLVKGPPLPSHDNRIFRLIRMAGVLILDERGPHLYALNPPILPRAELLGNA
ncbi:MAG TPA: hypothetical protein VHY37_02540, partial [Tepidisphaeraceae bacterium]|nr:hypothetical protein [Tepidisphaeraceae bacterium]